MIQFGPTASKARGPASNLVNLVPKFYGRGNERGLLASLCFLFALCVSGVQQLIQQLRLPLLPPRAEVVALAGEPFAVKAQKRFQPRPQSWPLIGQACL